MPIIFDVNGVTVKTERDTKRGRETAYESDPVFYYSIFVSDNHGNPVRKKEFSHREREGAIEYAKELAGIANPAFLVQKVVTEPGAPEGVFKSKEIIAVYTDRGEANHRSAGLRFNDPVTIIRGSVIEVPLNPKE